MDAPRKRGRPPSAVKSKKRSMTFPPRLYQQLAAVAEREERPISDVILDAVRRGLKDKAPGNSEPLSKVA